MLKITKIEVETLENAGCNNGNYPEYTLYFENGKTYTGITCRCHAGCSGTDNIRNIKVGMEFADFEEIDEFVQQ